MIARLALMIVCWLALSGPVSAFNRTVWIDADPACGLSMKDDVDDCWAIVAALKSSAIDIAGLSTVFGNVSHARSSQTARHLLNMVASFEPDVEIPRMFAGAVSPMAEISAMPEAVTALERALELHPMTILALGPLTNIALLIRKRPDLAHRISAIIAVGGQLPGQVFKVGRTPFLHFHDLNVRKDVDAFETVLKSGAPVHLVPFELSRQVMVRRDDLAWLKIQGELASWLARISYPWLGFWQSAFGADGFSPFDTLAVAYLVAPHYFSCEELPARVVRRRGLFTVRDSLEIETSLRTGTMVRYCTKVSTPLQNSIVNFITSPDLWMKTPMSRKFVAVRP